MFAALRARFVRNRATRSNYITSATGIGKLGVAAAAGDLDGCALELSYDDADASAQAVRQLLVILEIF